MLLVQLRIAGGTDRAIPEKPLTLCSNPTPFDPFAMSYHHCYSQAPSWRLPRCAQCQPKCNTAHLSLNALRHDCTPATWKDLFAVVGVSDADALLVQIGRSVLSALEALPLSVENAQSRLLVMRGQLHAAVDRRCDELEAGIRNAEITKAVKA